MIKTVPYLILFMFGALGCFHANAEPVLPKAKIADLVVGEQLTFDSSVLHESRTLNIRLPEAYQSRLSETFPVIVVLDGGLDEDFIHIAGLTQFLSFPWIKHIPESIVVGIKNVDRKRDFTFVTTNERDKKDFPTTGHSAEFIQFLSQELMPLLEQQYRVSDIKVLMGQSLGGLLATEVLLKHSTLFTHYLIVSPSMWWDNGSLFEQVATSNASFNRVFIAVGKEGKIMEEDATKLHDKLVEKFANKPIGFQFYPELNHGDALHKAAYDGLSFLFKEPEAKTKQPL